MELTTLRYFREIARTRHLTRAARTLGVTQPALSAMVKKLESEVGSPLLDRSSRGVTLTEAGRVFLTHAEDALRAAEAGAAAVRRLAGLDEGSIRIGGGATATTYLLPRVVSEVRRRHPGLRFYIREAGSSTVAAAVLSGELDLGIVTLPITLPNADELLRVPLVTDELRLIVPPGHTRSRRGAGAADPQAPTPPGSNGGGFRWKEIDGASLVAFEAGTAVRGMIDRAAAAAGVALNVIMELRSIESIKSMVAAGIGVGFVSRFALSAGAGLRCRDAPLTRQMAIVRRRNRLPSAAAAEFERRLLARGGAVRPG
ncbi:MAG: LysR family transcriptional regulator [Phycisphaerae bacterium]|nr:LysR family transcriptional regulator [Phycisphaerae bacterium]